jgi:hypothetical protein
VNVLNYVYEQRVGTATFTVDFQGAQPTFFFTVNPGNLPATPGQLQSQSEGGKQLINNGP